MTVEELIEKGASIEYHGSKNPFKIIEVYREKFVLISNGKEEKVLDKETVLDYWTEEEKLRIEAEQAKNGTSNIEKYFELYGPLNKRSHFDQNKDKYASEYASKGFSTILMHKVKPTPNDIWNSKIFFLEMSVNHCKNTNNYFKKPGKVSDVYMDFNHSDEWCIECSIVDGKPKLRHSHHWYDNLENEWTPKYEDWNDDLEYSFELFWQYCVEDMLNHFNLEKPLLKQNDWVYQDGSKFIFEISTLRLNGCEILNNGKIRNRYLSTSAFPKAFKSTTTFEEIKNNFRLQFEELIKNPRDKYFRG